VACSVTPVVGTGSIPVQTRAALNAWRRAQYGLFHVSCEQERVWNIGPRDLSDEW
jgi:hypothetical protein